MNGFYANITLHGPNQTDVIAYLNSTGTVSYVAPTVKSSTVIFHEDLGSQEELASRLSAHFRCPALLVLGYGGSVLLYQLYESGAKTDAYVSSPHDDLDTGGEPVPEGSPERLCAAFEMERMVLRVERILRKPGSSANDYAYAVNRHGELARALGLPLFAAGAGYGSIEMGELPEGNGFDPSRMKKTGS